MTGAHAIHLIIGLCLAGFMLTRLTVAALEVTALYWHLVDMVWIFLYPLLYLVSRT
jgi:cytochrome c oxidase subunit 3